MKTQDLPTKHILWVLRLRAAKLQNAVDHCLVLEKHGEAQQQIGPSELRHNIAKLQATVDLAVAMGLLEPVIVTNEYIELAKESYLWLVDNPDGETNEQGD